MKKFYDKCYEVLRKVPSGKVTTYKDIAIALHSKAYRAVGNAMKNNPYAPDVPCHRVVNSDGSVGNYARGKKSKIKMLKREGIKIKSDKINLDEYGWKKSGG